MQKYRPFLIIAFVVVVGIIGTLILVRRSNRDRQPPDLDGQPSSATSDAPEQNSAPRKLPSDLVIKVEEFGDYQCPPCAQLHPVFKKLKQDYGPNLNFVFRNFPLEQLHKNALPAAQAAEAARMQNRFWEMHDMLFENQQLWSAEAHPWPIFIKFARDLELDINRFSNDMEGEQVRLRIQADKDAGIRLGVAATPTIFIDGLQLKAEATTPGGIRKAIEFVISEQTDDSP